MAYTERYVSALAAGGGDGSVGSPWTFEESVSAATNGMRINVKADGDYTIIGGSASFVWVDVTRCGTPALPVMWRGYGTTIGDGVKAKLVNGGDVKYLSVVGDVNSRYNLVIRDFEIRIAGLTNGKGAVDALDGAVFINCRFEQTRADGANHTYAVTGQRCAFISCEFVTAHQSAGAAATFQHLFTGCLFLCANHLFLSLSGTFGQAFCRNVCVCTTAGNTARIANSSSESGGDANRPTLFANNVFVGFNGGLVFKGDNIPNGIWMNNIFASATNGVVLTNDLSSNTDHALIFLGNRYYAVTSPFSAYLDQLNEHMAPWYGFTEITSDPFVDAANGDYRITQASGLIDTALPMYDSQGVPLCVDVGVFDITPVEDYPDEDDVRFGVDYKSGVMTGSCHVPISADVRHGEAVDATTGTCHVPPPADVRSGVPVESTVGTCAVPANTDTKHGVPVDDTLGTCHVPPASDVRFDVDVAQTVGTCHVPDPEDVKRGVAVESTVGTFDARRDLTFKDESSVS